jgi:hypothetical protein
MISDIVVFLLGILFGAACVILIFRSRHMQELKKKAEKDVDRWMGLTGGRIWAQHMPLFSELVQQISPSFCKIYGEASAAEAGELDQICGIGYGKSLEFLIKDYAKYENPSDRAIIETSRLGVCIKRYTNDPAIRDSAELAAWLRNDEAHYIRRYVDKDVKDLKQLIALTVRLIEHAEEKKQMVASLQQSRQGFEQNLDL